MIGRAPPQDWSNSPQGRSKPAIAPVEVVPSFAELAPELVEIGPNLIEAGQSLAQTQLKSGRAGPELCSNPPRI